MKAQKPKSKSSYIVAALITIIIAAYLLAYADTVNPWVIRLIGVIFLLKSSVNYNNWITYKKPQTNE